MSGILKELAFRHSLTANRTQAWGVVDGFWFQIALPSSRSAELKLRTAVKLPDEAAAGIVDKGLADMTKLNPSVSFERRGASIVMSLRKPSRATGADLADAIMLRLISLFRKAAAVPACYNCGTDAPDGFSSVNGTALRLCPKCGADSKSVASKQAEDILSVKNNYLRGFAGALIGALAGSVLWIVLGYFGYFAAIGGVAISFCALKGYTAMKGRISIPAVFIICLSGLVIMLVAQLITYDLFLMKISDAVGFGAAMGMILRSLFVNNEFTSRFVKDFFFGLLFLLLGSYTVIRPLISGASARFGKVNFMNRK